MLATIIESPDSKTSHAYISSLPQTLTHHVIKDPSSIGIETIKKLIPELSITTPFPRLVWIDEAQLLSRDAAGALLKILEEPPHNTHLVLSCPSALSLLPTIRSRCQIISLNSTIPTITTNSLQQLKPLFSLSAGDRLNHITDFGSDRSEQINYFANLTLEIHQTISHTQSLPGLSMLNSLATLVLSTYDALKHNVNNTLALTHFLLHLPKTR